MTTPRRPFNWKASISITASEYLAAAMAAAASAVWSTTGSKRNAAFSASAAT